MKKHRYIKISIIIGLITVAVTMVFIKSIVSMKETIVSMKETMPFYNKQIKEKDIKNNLSPLLENLLKENSIEIKNILVSEEKCEIEGGFWGSLEDAKKRIENIISVDKVSNLEYIFLEDNFCSFKISVDK